MGGKAPSSWVTQEAATWSKLWTRVVGHGVWFLDWQEGWCYGEQRSVLKHWIKEGQRKGKKEGEKNAVWAMNEEVILSELRVDSPSCCSLCFKPSLFRACTSAPFHIQLPTQILPSQRPPLTCPAPAVACSLSLASFTSAYFFPNTIILLFVSLVIAWHRLLECNVPEVKDFVYRAGPITI